ITTEQLQLMCAHWTELEHVTMLVDDFSLQLVEKLVTLMRAQSPFFLKHLTLAIAVRSRLDAQIPTRLMNGIESLYLCEYSRTVAQSVINFRDQELKFSNLKQLSLSCSEAGFAFLNKEVIY